MDVETSYAKLYMDPDLHHSSGYFREGVVTLEEAQKKKVDVILERLRLQEPSLRLLDVGCGWGATAIAAADRYRADVTGITISQYQHTYARSRISRRPAAAPLVEFHLRRWEEFTEPVDRIICVNAFENFENKEDFLPHCRRLLRAEGRMVMLTVTADRPIFRVVPSGRVVEWAERAGFDVEISPSLAGDYARTLDLYVSNLRARRNEVIALVGKSRFVRQVDYYSRCAGFLRSGINDMFEFTFTLR